MLRTRLVGPIVLGLMAPLTLTAPPSTASLASRGSTEGSSSVGEAAAGTRVTFDGGDVIMLPRPRVVRSASRTGTTWTTVKSAGAVPTAGVGAVLVALEVRSAGRSGQLSVRAAGARGGGYVVATYSRKADRYLALVKAGLSTNIQVRASAGRPRVAVEVVGYTTETSTLVVPEALPAPVAVQFGRQVTKVPVAGRGGVPSGAGLVVVSVRTVSTKGGSALAWSSGRRAPKAGHAFGRGTDAMLLTLRPAANGKISLKAPAGTAKATLQVVAWSVRGSTATAVSDPGRLGNVKPGSVRKVAIAGVGGIPGSAQDAAFSINAKAGARVRVWSSPRTGKPPVVDVISTGGSIDVWLPVPQGRKVAVRVTGTRSTATLTSSGFVSRTGNQRLSFVPQSNTRILGPGDVVAEDPPARTITIAPSAGPVQAGDHAFVTTRTGASSPVRITAVAAAPGGRRVLTLEKADLADVFVDYDASYHGVLSQEVDVDADAALRRSAIPGGTVSPTSIGLTFLDIGNWKCSGEVNLSQLMSVDAEYDGDVNLDFSLDTLSLDFSIKGRVLLIFSFFGESSVSCSVEGSLPPIWIGTTGIYAALGGTAGLSATTPDLSSGGTFTASAGVAVYAGYYYYAGESGGTQTASPLGEVEASFDGLELALDLGVFVKAGVGFDYLVSDVADANGSLTSGLRLKVSRPEHLRGPRCLDVDLQPYLKFGAELVLWFAPDVRTDIPAWEGPDKPLYRGPCWGYAGTVTYTVKGVDSNCGGCSIVEHDEKLTLTMIPQPAQWVAGDVRQPFSWTASQHNTYTSAVFGEGHTCVITDTAAGAGSHGWNGYPPAVSEPPLVVRDVADASGGRTYQAHAQEFPAVGVRTHTGTHESCLLADSPVEQYAVAVPHIDPAPHPVEFATLETVDLTWENPNGLGSSIMHKVVYDLTRGEYPRPES